MDAWKFCLAVIRGLVAADCFRPFFGAVYEFGFGTVTIQNRVHTMEVTKALAALQPLYGKGNVEIITRDGVRVRGIVRSMKTTQALTTPSVKVERADGQIVKVPFPRSRRSSIIIQ
jgi:hypothetical protein